MSTAHRAPSLARSRRHELCKVFARDDRAKPLKPAGGGVWVRNGIVCCKYPSWASGPGLTGWNLSSIKRMQQTLSVTIRQERHTSLSTPDSPPDYLGITEHLLSHVAGQMHCVRCLSWHEGGKERDIEPQKDKTISLILLTTKDGHRNDIILRFKTTVWGKYCYF